MSPQAGSLIQSYMGNMMQDPQFINRLVELGMQNPNDEILGSVAGSILEQMLQPPDVDSERAWAMDLITQGMAIGDQKMVDAGTSILEKMGVYGGQPAQPTETTMGDINASSRVNELSALINDPEMAGLKNQYMTELAYLNQAPGMQAPSGSRFYVDEKTNQYGYEPEKIGLGDKFKAAQDAPFWKKVNPLNTIAALFGDPYGAREDYRTVLGNSNDLDYGLVQQYLQDQGYP